jgi:hypothetical protein
MKVTFIEAITGSSSVAHIDVPSLKVAVVVLFDVGRSLTCIIYGMGSKTCPCSTPASVEVDNKKQKPEKTHLSINVL